MGLRYVEGTGKCYTELQQPSRMGQRPSPRGMKSERSSRLRHQEEALWSPVWDRFASCGMKSLSFLPVSQGMLNPKLIKAAISRSNQDYL